MGREEGSGWGTHVYLWQIHFDIWQNQYNIVKLNKIKLKKKKIYDKSRQHIQKQRHKFTNEYPYTPSVVLEKTLESPLDCKEIQPVNPKGNQS